MAEDARDRNARVNLSLVETRMFPDGVVLTRYETRRSVPDLGSARASGHPKISSPLGDLYRDGIGAGAVSERNLSARVSLEAKA